jgi:O-methyltransferase
MSGVVRSFLRFLSRRDESSRFALLTALGGRILPRYRFKWPQMAWWDDADFNRYLERFAELPGFNTDRKWALSQLLRLIADVPGDTAECGVFLGASSWLICSANAKGARPRVHHAFDSFEGLSRPKGEDGAFWKGGDLSVPEETSRKNLAEFSDCRFYKGWIPERFPEVADRAFAFVHVDVDLYEPTRASVAFFYPRLAAGGILVCDDYGFTTCPGATRAIDEFLADKPEKMLALPDGGGMLVKGTPTRAA